MTQRPLFGVAALAVLTVLASCSREGLQERCAPVNPSFPTFFSECAEGSGHFGRWIVDASGLPAYEYTLTQERSPLALFWNSENRERRDHWHQVGNGRVLAIAGNDGTVQVFNQDRGYKWLNKFSGDEGNFGGGFGYIKDGDAVWSTAYRYRPPDTPVRRVFGMGYVETSISHSGVEVARKTYAPPGPAPSSKADPIILSDVRVTNRSSAAKSIVYYEYWDVNIHQMLLAAIMSGLVDPHLPGFEEEKRSAFNRYFTQTVVRTPESNGSPPVFQVETVLADPYTGTAALPSSPDVSGDFDAYPFPIFFAPLSAVSSSSGALDLTGGGVFFTQEVFFGSGGPRSPDSAARGAAGISVTAPVPASLQGVGGLGQPLCFVHSLPLTLAPGESVTLRYAYGLSITSDIQGMIAQYGGQGSGPFEKTLSWWKGRLAYFAPDRDPVLHREMAWHSYYLQSAGGYSQYYNARIVSQGGQYLYGHGFDGAPRDFSLFTIPLTYLDPLLAKEVLKTIMEITDLSDDNGQILYAIFNFGKGGGLVVHDKPSDLDIFFLWALSEYLMATRDFGFLSEKVPFYSLNGLDFSGNTSTVFDHVLTAVTHLTQSVGFGEHGLIRVRDGDWNDGISLFSPDITMTKEKGESGFNTAFAAAVLPLAASALAGWDPSTSSLLFSTAEDLKAAMLTQWTGRWFLRGWFGDGQSLGGDRLFLEPQPFSVIGGFADEGQRKILIGSIKGILDDPSPAGALILYPPLDTTGSAFDGGGLSPGTDINGGIWHAMNAFLTWAYFLTDPGLGWRSLKKNTLSTHASVYPDLWYGIWTGPDSYNAPYSKRPGQAAVHMATALTDFPAMNANQHSDPLLALIKGAGITPQAGGIRFSPRFPLKEWSLDLPLLGISVSTSAVSGYYNGIVDDTMTLTVPLPSGADPSRVRVSVDGVPVNFTANETEVSFLFAFRPGHTTVWSVVPIP